MKQLENFDKMTPEHLKEIAEAFDDRVEFDVDTFESSEHNEWYEIQSRFLSFVLYSDGRVSVKYDSHYNLFDLDIYNYLHKLNELGYTLIDDVEPSENGRQTNKL